MVTISFENTKNVEVGASDVDVRIDIKDRNGGYTRIEMPRDVAKYLCDQLRKALRKI